MHDEGETYGWIKQPNDDNTAGVWDQHAMDGTMILVAIRESCRSPWHTKPRPPNYYIASFTGEDEGDRRVGYMFDLSEYHTIEALVAAANRSKSSGAGGRGTAAQAQDRRRCSPMMRQYYKQQQQQAQQEQLQKASRFHWCILPPLPAPFLAHPHAHTANDNDNAIAAAAGGHAAATYGDDYDVYGRPLHWNLKCVTISSSPL
jgi:hypothetical protein